jgi:hypothetical protein
MARAEQLELVLHRTQLASAERDRRMACLERELDLARTEAASQIRGLATLGAELEELQVTARGQATRIRLEALREAAEVSDRVRALGNPPAGSVETLLAALRRAIDRLGTAWHGGGPEPAPEPAAPRSGPEADSELAELEAALEGSEALRMSVDVGPFRDFSQLVSFEDAANAIEATGEISIRRFSEGRASIEVALQTPIDLLSELQSRCELDFVVRSSNAEELILDLSD